MSGNALYYPTISFQDPSWVKAMSLYHDRIYRIVPPTEKAIDHEELRPLIDTGLVGIKIDPVPYSREASQLFLDKINGSWDAASLCGDPEGKEALTRIHSTKVDQQVRDLFKTLGFREDGDWISVPHELASNYMLFLATQIAKRNQLSLLTDSLVSWSATTYFGLDGKMEYSMPLDELRKSKNGSYLFGLMLQDLVPVNIAEIPSDKIAKFKESRRAEIVNLKKSVEALQAEISQIEDDSVAADKVLDSISSVKQAVEDYQKSADLINAKGWFGVQMLGVPTSAIGLAKIFNISDVQTAVMVGTGIVLGGIYSLNAKKAELAKLAKDNPYSALALIGDKFRDYKSSALNYKAYNCLEEYIND